MNYDILERNEESLHSLINNYADNEKNIYKTIYEIIKDILEDYYKQSLCEISFPVNIWKIIKKYDIEIIETDLNTDIGFQIARQNGSLRYLADGRIQLYLEASDSDNAKRYILAHEFAHFLMNTAGGAQNAGCGDPMMPKNWEEQTADMIAACLLFPPELVLKKMRSFIDQMKEKNRYPISSAEWLEALSESAQVSSYYTITSYQYIKSFICYLYSIEDSFVTDEKFADLFK